MPLQLDFFLTENVLLLNNNKHIYLLHDLTYAYKESHTIVVNFVKLKLNCSPMWGHLHPPLAQIIISCSNSLQAKTKYTCGTYIVLKNRVNILFH